MKRSPLTAAAVVLALLLGACGGSDSSQADSGPLTEPSVTVVPIPTDGAGVAAPPDADATPGTGDPQATVDPAATTGPAGDTDPAPTTDPAAPSDAADPAPAGAAYVGEWPNRYCVDIEAVETTLNLRAEASTDSAVLASIPRESCDLVVNGLGEQDGFQPVLYTTAEGTTAGFVSTDFIVFQDPPERIEAAALLFVEAWQLGVDTTQYSYGIDALPTPITAGRPVPVEGPEGAGCVLVGDVSVDCTLALVEDDGTEIARLSIGASQRGANGYDGEPYFDADFPDGPTITSFTVVDG